MGASVSAYWPGIEEELTEEQLDSQPGFFNDSKAWGNWMAEREYEPHAIEAIRKLNADAILTYTTHGVKVELCFARAQDQRGAGGDGARNRPCLKTGRAFGSDRFHFHWGMRRGAAEKWGE